MRRMTISMEDDLADLFDAFMAQRGYESRSEAIRDLLRGELGRESFETGSAPECVAALSFVFNHHERQLASRVAALQHEHHDLTVSSMHVHLDHDDCVETAILRGPTALVTQFAESVVAEKGIRHGKINLIPVDRVVESHGHGHGHHHGPRTRHVHMKPRL
ncbi:MAG: nickel-responsive transcriptional regulator NikR [Proteobacteria bacterium]|nr:MAG: nickel-responsive transcriptional regulator NikR [Pseudomonadota bacterium]